VDLRPAAVSGAGAGRPPGREDQLRGGNPGAGLASRRGGRDLDQARAADATLQARRALGDAWFFDLQGHGTQAGCRTLSWSPVTRAGDWQQAQLISEAMTGASEHDQDAAHWSERAAALIACLLHAAARAGLSMRELQGWVLRHDVDGPLAELQPDSIAADVLYGIKRSADRERSGIFSTAARVLRAYRSPVALQASEQPTFDPDSFVASHDTVYIAAAAHEQRLLAPLVVGLLTEIRQAAYRRAFQTKPVSPPVMLMLDECANSPRPDRPASPRPGAGDDRPHWQLLPTLPYDRHPSFTKLTQPAPAVLAGGCPEALPLTAPAAGATLHRGPGEGPKLTHSGDSQPVCRVPSPPVGSRLHSDRL